MLIIVFSGLSGFYTDKTKPRLGRYLLPLFFCVHPVNFVILARVPIMSPYNQWPTQGGQSPSWSATAYLTSPHKLSLTAALVSFILISKAPFTRYNLLSNRLSNRFDNRLYRVCSRLYNAVWQPAERSTRLSNPPWLAGVLPSEIVLNEQPLFVQPVVKPGLTTGCTGLTTGCIV